MTREDPKGSGGRGAKAASRTPAAPASPGSPQLATAGSLGADACLSKRSQATLQAAGRTTGLALWGRSGCAAPLWADHPPPPCTTITALEPAWCSPACSWCPGPDTSALASAHPRQEAGPPRPVPPCPSAAQGRPTPRLTHCPSSRSQADPEEDKQDKREDALGKLEPDGGRTGPAVTRSRPEAGGGSGRAGRARPGCARGPSPSAPAVAYSSAVSRRKRSWSPESWMSLREERRGHLTLSDREGCQARGTTSRLWTRGPGVTSARPRCRPNQEPLGQALCSWLMLGTPLPKASA